MATRNPKRETEEGRAVTYFDMRWQRVNNQTNTINFGSVMNKVDVVTQLELLRAEIAKAVEDKKLDEESGADIEYMLTKTILQAKKEEPDKKTMVQYLSDAKNVIAGLVGGAATLAGLVVAFSQAIEVVQKYY